MTSVGYLKRLLHVIFEQAMNYDIVMRNVVERTASIPKSEFEGKPLTDDEVLRLISVLPDNDYGLFVLVAIVLGMRPAEIRGLRWSNIVPSADGWSGVAQVRQQIQDKEGGGYNVQSPKTKKSKRDLPIPAFLVAKLKVHRYRREEERTAVLAAGLQDFYPVEWSDLVFQGREGLPLAERYLRDKFKQFLSTAGLDMTTRLYDMRHTTNAVYRRMGIAPRGTA